MPPRIDPWFEYNREGEEASEAMDYVGAIFRPPSEADSLLVQVTLGCSHNRCTFCGMYRDKPFAPKPFARVEADLQEAARLGPRFARVFLCDGDALILSTDRLLRVLAAIRQYLPWVERVGVYGDPRCVRNKSLNELRALQQAGLGIIYHGLESGDDEVLRRIEKGTTRDDAVEMAGRLREAGILHSVIVLLGIAGPEGSEQHARRTAEALTAMDPPYVGALTTTLVPGTSLHRQAEQGTFLLPGRFGFLAELREILARFEATRGCRFSSNHASSYLPLHGDLPRDRQRLLDRLDRVLEIRDERLLRPEFVRGL